MKKLINESDFLTEFARSDRNNNFTYEGKKALFEYLERYEEDIGEELELDIIALCCDFTEYASLEELKKDYSDIETMEDLQDATMVIEIDEDSFIIQNF